MSQRTATATPSTATDSGAATATDSGAAGAGASEILRAPGADSNYASVDAGKSTLTVPLLGERRSAQEVDLEAGKRTSAASQNSSSSWVTAPPTRTTSAASQNTSSSPSGSFALPTQLFKTGPGEMAQQGAHMSGFSIFAASCVGPDEFAAFDYWIQVKCSLVIMMQVWYIVLGLFSV
jgi:hypothetical protein